MNSLSTSATGQSITPIQPTWRKSTKRCRKRSSIPLSGTTHHRVPHSGKVWSTNSKGRLMHKTITAAVIVFLVVYIQYYNEELGSLNTELQQLTENAVLQQEIIDLLYNVLKVHQIRIEKLDGSFL